MEPNKKAIDIFKKYGNGIIPVDIKFIIEKHNIILVEENLPIEISGVLDLRENKKPIIMINSNHHINRKRFTMSHELGHYLLHNNNTVHIDKKSFFRDEKAHEGIFQKEIEANQFAAELLMPTEILINTIHKYNKIDILDDSLIEDLSDSFKVSKIAMSIKLQNLFKEYYNNILF